MEQLKDFHTFAVCAYQDSPYLEACIRSATRQTYPTKSIICTSTPSLMIEGLAEKYHLPLFIREGESDILEDWNFAYQMADARFVTIAHQDDIYRKNYVRTLVNYARKFSDIILFTTDSITVKEKKPIPVERLRIIKKLLRIPLRVPYWNHFSFVKKSALRFGNSICCPACTYNKEMLGEVLFSSSCKFALDWEQGIKLAEKPGRFICAEEPLIFHRLHQKAATSACMKDSLRYQEELEIFKRLWPEKAARWLMAVYQKAYDSYK